MTDGAESDGEVTDGAESDGAENDGAENGGAESGGAESEERVGGERAGSWYRRAPANKKLAVVRVVDARAARTAVRAVMVAVRVTV